MHRQQRRFLRFAEKYEFECFAGGCRSRIMRMALCKPV
jgi:hypothetical protein